MVPLVSTAISKPRACRASMSGASSCSSGSPPVQTTKRLPGRVAAGHFSFDGRSQRLGRRKLSAAGTIGVGKIRVAELADRRCAVGFAAGPEIAARKAAEDRGASRVRAFALQRVKISLTEYIRAASSSSSWLLAHLAIARSSNPHRKAETLAAVFQQRIFDAVFAEAFLAQQAGVALAAGRARGPGS